MDTATLLLGAGQVVLAVAVGYIAYLLRRDAKRSSLAALITVLGELREKNGKALAAVLALMASDDFRRGDQQLRSGLIDSSNHLRAIEAAVTEALLHTLRQCDAEWGFAGRLYAAFRSQAQPGAEKQWERAVAQPGTP